MLALLHLLLVCRWPLVPCTVFETMYVQGRDHGNRTPGPLTFTLCVHFPSSCWGPCMPGVVVFPSVTVALFFSPCTDVKMMNLNLVDGEPHTSIVHQLSCPIPSFVNAPQHKQTSEKSGWWNAWCPVDSSVKSMNTPVGCVFRWLWRRNLNLSTPSSSVKNGVK